MIGHSIKVEATLSGAANDPQTPDNQRHYSADVDKLRLNRCAREFVPVELILENVAWVRKAQHGKLENVEYTTGIFGIDVAVAPTAAASASVGTLEELDLIHYARNICLHSSDLLFMASLEGADLVHQLADSAIRAVAILVRRQFIANTRKSASISDVLALDGLIATRSLVGLEVGQPNLVVATRKRTNDLARFRHSLHQGIVGNHIGEGEWGPTAWALA
mmetsp:Transcript_11511/g.32626  ORF Transcript_11511/g.32626 Transcript_11511/m.32626 type:complete len:220 (-) Transcript_11511:1365-2024(-)